MTAKASPNFRQQVLTFIGATLLLTALAAIDRASGPHVHLGPIYLIPVGIAAWFGGRWPGYGLGVGTILAWMLISKANVGTPLDVRAEALNIVLRVIYYPVMIELLVLKRSMQRRLESQVEIRTAELRQQVAERERAEQSLHKLAAQLSAAEDAQRRQLAYDIHDSLSQMLGVVKMNLEAALAEANPVGRQHERLSDLVGVCNDLIRRTRELTFDLHPPMLDDLGLVPALRGFAEEMHRRTNTEFTVSEVGQQRAIPVPLASYLFRAVKELIHNAVKHGRAAEVVVGVHWLPTGLRVVVDDDGSGFDPAATRQNRRGLGLPGIEERITSLGGQLRFDSHPGQGTRVILETPLKPATPQEPAPREPTPATLEMVPQ